MNSKREAEDVQVLALDSGDIQVRVPSFPPTTCSGPSAPTSTNVDLVRVRFRKFADNSAIVNDLGPGATPELDGTDEIEVDVLSPDDFAEVTYKGDKDADTLAAGAFAGLTAIDLNTSEGKPAEADISLPKRGFVNLATGGGEDSVSARGIKSGSFLSVNAGPGDDVVLGSSGTDFLFGGKGADDLQGRKGDDLIDPAAGPDLANAGPGKDLIFVFDDSGHDEADCGTGRDRYSADRGDDLARCERELHFGPDGSGEWSP